MGSMGGGVKQKRVAYLYRYLQVKWGTRCIKVTMPPEMRAGV
jgi:hypothetical protein